MAEIHGDVDGVGVGQLRKDPKKLLRVNEPVSIGDCVITLSASINNFLDELALSHMLVPQRRQKPARGKPTQRRSYGATTLWVRDNSEGMCQVQRVEKG